MRGWTVHSGRQAGLGLQPEKARVGSAGQVQMERRKRRCWSDCTARDRDRLGRTSSLTNNLGALGPLGRTVERLRVRGITQLRRFGWSAVGELGAVDRAGGAKRKILELVGHGRLPGHSSEEAKVNSSGGGVSMGGASNTPSASPFCAFQQAIAELALPPEHAQPSEPERVPGCVVDFFDHGLALRQAVGGAGHHRERDDGVNHVHGGDDGGGGRVENQAGAATLTS